MLDLFCGAGGAAKGYYDAGFDHIVGVDINFQRNYPFEFAKGDALEVLRTGKVADYGLEDFAAIHLSPPCQAFSVTKYLYNSLHHPDLVTPSKELLNDIDIPYVIENVEGAPIRPDLTLCGTMFNLRVEGAGELLRHRIFEFGNWNFYPKLLSCNHTDAPTVSIYGNGGKRFNSIKVWREIMGTPWMKRQEITQAIPPKYTEYIGKHLINFLDRQIDQV